ncbi:MULTISPECIES: ComEC/Rec2 family competence protein [Ruminococcus]|jgi:competence protein ComEC|uniref:ComEC/Rec2 family competence protein n=1 Tax=Ruminococcus sp. TaxID=41978 RepID=UPI002600A34B|nr:MULTISPECIES: ComEC/Rec2 family competence protein [Ruminococcus]
MKRLFGLIGFTFLFVLSAVFYSDFNEIVFAIIGSLGVLSVAVGIFLIISKKNKSFGKSLCVFAFAVLYSAGNIIGYSEYINNTIINKYSDKEITASGYICDEIITTDSSCSFVIKTDKINGQPSDAKIQIISYTNVDAEPFEKVSFTAHTYKNNVNSQISHGIFLKAYSYNGFKIDATGEKATTFYSFAVSIRRAMKNSLDMLLPEDYSTLCRAVLLGEKTALDSSVKDDFSLTGTSFLIVVSGMHLVIITSFVLLLVRKLTKNRFLITGFTTFTVIAFMAVTGFAHSVVRAGIMMIIVSFASSNLRIADSLNNLGFAAIVLTAFNPYAVADIGMLLSFTATTGIILWSRPIERSVLRFFHYKNKRKDGIVGTIVYYIKNFFKICVNMLSVSISAFLWILPITAVAFNRISPTVILVSLLCEPFVSALLVCSLLCSVLYICPFISFFAYPFALVSGLCSKAILWLVSTFSQLPFSTVKTHSFYWFVWIGVSVLLAIGGLFVINRKFYVRISVSVSISVLVIGASLNVLLTADNAEMKIFSVGNGVFATVNCPENTSVISCGGGKSYADDVTTDLAEYYSAIDYLIILNQNNKYSALEPFTVTKFDLNNILVYDSDIEKQKLLNAFDGNSRQTFGGNQHFTLNLSDTVTDEIICADKTMFQYIKGKSATVLFVPTDADITNLPENYRNPDYLLIDSVPENADLISCKAVIFSGTEKQLQKRYDSIKEISHTVISTADGSITVNLNGG